MSNAKVRARRRRRARTATPPPVRQLPTPWTEDQRDEVQRLIEALPLIPIGRRPNVSVSPRVRAVLVLAAVASLGFGL